MNIGSFSGICLAIILSINPVAHAGMLEAKDAYAHKKYQVMLDNLKPLVKMGVPEAMYYVALLYDNGEGLAQNVSKAKQWYLRAAGLGYAPAQNNLGWVLQTDISDKPSDIEAAKWYLKSAQQGYAPAQYNLGLLYFAGRGGVPKDPREAAYWFRMAAEQGYSPAQNSLAKMYQYGMGVQVSLDQAYKLFYLAAEAGNEAAGESKLAIEQMMAPDMIDKGKSLALEWQAKQARQRP